MVRTDRVRARLRDLVIAALSIAAVLLTVVFFAAPSEATLTTSDVSITRITVPREVVYGKVTVADGKLRSAHVTVARHVGRRWVRVGFTRANAKGLYRMGFKRFTGRWRVTIVATARGVTRTVTRMLAVRPYHAYRVSARLSVRRALFFLPIFSY